MSCEFVGENQIEYKHHWCSDRWPIFEVSVRKMTEQLNINYKTVYHAVHLIRLAILSHAEDAEDILSGEIELDESYFGGRRKGKRGRGAAGKVPVFGILERNGKVRVSVVSQRNPWFEHEDLDMIVKSGALDGHANVLDLKDYQRALVWIDGRFDRVLGPGLYALWTKVRHVKVDVVDAGDVR